MNILVGIIIFFFGTIIGSFLNVVIYRFQSGRGFGGRSMCMSCTKTLQWFELIPIASFIVQDGKCRTCRSRISKQYPLVEAVTGFIFMLLVLKFSYLIETQVTLFVSLLVYYMYFFSLLIVIAVYDYRHKIIPDRIVWVFIVTAFLGQFALHGTAFYFALPGIMAFFAGPIIAAPFILIWYFSKGKMMGLGDAKLMIGIGYLLGLSQGVAAVMLGFFAGALFAIIILLLRRSRFTMKSEIPFGPFLVFGTLIAFLYGVTTWALVMAFQM